MGGPIGEGWTAVRGDCSLRKLCCEEGLEKCVWSGVCVHVCKHVRTCACAHRQGSTVGARGSSTEEQPWEGGGVGTGEWGRGWPLEVRILFQHNRRDLLLFL